MENVAVSVDYGLLQSLHRMLRQLTDIRERMDKGPIKVRVVAANEQNFASESEAAQGRVDELRRASNDKQMQLAEREAKIEDMKSKLNTCDSNKEFQLLKDRIAADEQANLVLQDEILEQLERLDVLNEELAAAKKNHQKAQAETKAMKDKVALELEELAAEQQRLTAELAEAEKKLPVALSDDYRRAVEKKGEDTLASTNTETCDNCHSRVRTQMASNLLMKKPVKCEGCGAILYIKS